jgi:glycosyltransferase involved in cell wall biosynthesis
VAATAEASAQPGLSVVVLTHDRIALLLRTLRSVVRQSFEPFEIIVVDNASSDGTEAAVRAEFLEVRFVRLEQNSGIRGRNIGFEAARAPLIVSLDDDIELSDPDTLKRIADRFAEQSDLGALTLKICEDDAIREFVPHHWWHAPPRAQSQDREFPTDHINEAAVAFRAAALAKGGSYYEQLFWGGEEWDLVLGMMDAGYEIRYFPLGVKHLAPRGSLNLRADPRHALLVRNRCWIAFRRLPIVNALGFALPRLALWAVRAARYGYFDQYLAGLASLVRAMPAVLRERVPISARTRARLAEIRHQSTGRLLA